MCVKILLSLPRPQRDDKRDCYCVYPGLVAGHSAAADTAARSPQGLDHSVLVEAAKSKAAGEEAVDGAGVLRTQRMGSRQAAVLDPHVAHPPAILSLVKRCPHHSGLLALAQLPFTWLYSGRVRTQRKPIEYSARNLSGLTGL